MIDSNGSMVRRWKRMCALLALSWFAAVGPAQGAEEAPAGESFGTTSWSRAYAKKEWALAVALLETIPERARTPWQWFHLARAREKLSLLVEAVDAYERARELVASSDVGAAALELRRKVEQEAAAVARRIPWAEIDVGVDIPRGAYVFVDDDWLPPARLRSPYPVNPGWHTFLLESDGEVLAARRVYFDESQQRPVSLVPKTEPRAFAPDLRSLPLPAEPSPSVLAPVSSRYTERQRDFRAASYFAFGAGALGVLMGTGFAIHSANLRSDLREIDDDCGLYGCDGYNDVTVLEQEIRASNQIVTASFVLGGLSAVTGGVLFVLSTKDGPKRRERPRPSLQPVIGLGGAALTGRF